MPTILTSTIDNFGFVITFGCVAIFYNLLFIVLSAVFLIRKTELNYSFGYRSGFALSSVNRWKWCNKIFFWFSIISQPIFLIVNIIIFILSLINNWSFAWITIAWAVSVAILIPISIFIELYGRHKFKNENIGPIEPLIENENSKKQDIDDFFS